MYFRHGPILFCQRNSRDIRYGWSVLAGEVCVVCVATYGIRCMVVSNRCFWVCLFRSISNFWYAKVLPGHAYVFVTDKLTESAAPYPAIWWQYYYYYYDYAVRPDSIPSVVIMDCSEIFVLVWKFIFNLGLTILQNLWQQAAIVPVQERNLKFIILSYMLFLNSK